VEDSMSLLVEKCRTCKMQAAQLTMAFNKGKLEKKKLHFGQICKRSTFPAENKGTRYRSLRHSSQAWGFLVARLTVHCRVIQACVRGEKTAVLRGCQHFRITGVGLR
jgi:hypothetical protein